MNLVLARIVVTAVVAVLVGLLSAGGGLLSKLGAPAAEALRRRGGAE